MNSTFEMAVKIILTMEKTNIGNPIYKAKNKPVLSPVAKKVNVFDKLEINRKPIMLSETPKCILFSMKIPAVKPTANPR